MNGEAMVLEETRQDDAGEGSKHGPCRRAAGRLQDCSRFVSIGRHLGIRTLLLVDKCQWHWRWMWWVLLRLNEENGVLDSRSLRASACSGAAVSLIAATSVSATAALLARYFLSITTLQPLTYKLLYTIHEPTTIVSESSDAHGQQTNAGNRCDPSLVSHL